MAHGSGAYPTPWWRAAVGYEVYIRSFADSNGDGIGDLDGVQQRLPYLAWLGIDIVWLTPFYPSPGFDHGYDISDFTAVDPVLGDVETMQSLLDDAHALGLRVIADITPNHSSSHHPFFVRASGDRTDEYRDWYIWRDPAPDGGPPNNWVSHFGGSAWTFDESSGQYYCHLFLPEQPDFNWRNPKVEEFFREVLRFWLDRGIDGFRVDVAHAPLKDPAFRDNPLWRDLEPHGSNWHVFNSYEHIHDVDQDETPALFEEWREVAAEYDALLLGELGLSDPERIARYPGAGLHTAFFLPPVWMIWKPADLLGRLRAMHEAEPRRMSWVLDNHDRSRSVTRYGGGDRGVRRSLAVTTLLFGLGGMPFLFQGQELGLDDGRIAPGDRQDPIATHEAGEGRDGARTAMPWEPGPSNGFTSGTPWLRAADRKPEETVAVQRESEDSTLSRIRRLIAVRRRLPDLATAVGEWLDVADGEVAMVRSGSAVVTANLAAETRLVHLPAGGWRVEFESRDVRLVGRQVVDTIELPPETTLIFGADRP